MFNPKPYYNSSGLIPTQTHMQMTWPYAQEIHNTIGWLAAIHIYRERERERERERWLEWFSGATSVSQVSETFGLDVVNSYLNHADIITDLSLWDCTTYEPKHVAVIWASHPYTEYGRALTKRARNINSVNHIVLNTLWIIEHLNPDNCILEHPQTGLLKQQPVMYGIPYKDIDCWIYVVPYRKWT